MASRISGRKLSFDIFTTVDAENDEVMLPRSMSDPPPMFAGSPENGNSKKKKKRRRKAKNSMIDNFIPNVISEEGTVNDRDGEVIDQSSFGDGLNAQNCSYSRVETTVVMESAEGRGSDRTACTTIPSPQFRQRNVNFVVNGGNEIEASQQLVTSSGTEESKDMGSAENEGKSLNGERERERVNESKVQMQQLEQPVEMNGRKLESEMSLDWKKLIPDDPTHAYPVEKSPMAYFFEEINAGNSLRSTIAPGDEKERERVYDTIFRLPWRCELLINVGFFVCLDSFLSLLTIMPARIMMLVWRLLRTRQFKKFSAAELSDFGCFVVLVSGVTLLQQADISLIYHMIRGQETVKLYVVYNVLEIFDKLCQSFVGDVMHTLFNTADGLANCSPDKLQYWQWRFILDEILTIVSSNILMLTIAY